MLYGPLSGRVLGRNTLGLGGSHVDCLMRGELGVPVLRV